MVPTVLFPPATESTDQFTPVLLLPASVAVNCCVPPGAMHGLRGAIVTLPEVGGAGLGPGAGPGQGPDVGGPGVTRYCEQPFVIAASAAQAANGQTNRRNRRTRRRLKTPELLIRKQTLKVFTCLGLRLRVGVSRTRGGIWSCSCSPSSVRCLILKRRDRDLMKFTFGSGV